MKEESGVKGSYTVEASLLMILLIPVLAGLLYLGYAEHNEACAYGRACEEVFWEAGKITEKPEKKITKTVTKRLEVPAMARKFLRISEVAEESCTLENKNPAKTVFQIHSLKKLVGGEG